MAFGLRRAREQSLVLATVAVVTATLVLGMSGWDAAATRSLDDGVESLVAAAGTTARAVQLDAPLAEDAAAQNRRFAAAIDEAFATAPVTTVRAVSGSADGVIDGKDTQLLLLADQSVAARSDLIAGSWPTAEDQVAVSTQAANRLGVVVSDEILVSGVVVTVAGLWTPRDPAEPAWFADPAIGSGAAGDEIGPILGSEPLVAAAAAAPRVSFTLVPSAAVTVRSAAAYAAAIRTLDAAVPSLDPEGGQGAQLSGDVGGTLGRAAAAVGSARAILVVPLSFIVLLGAFALAVLLLTLTGVRQEQWRLMRARGASAPTVVIGAGAETLVVAGAGSLGGLGLAIAANALGDFALITAIAAPLGAAAVTVIATATIFATPTRSGAVRPRAKIVRMLVPLALLATAAGVAVSQLAIRGLSPTGFGSIDPVAASAPTLTLVLLCALAALATAPAAWLAEAIAGRGRGLAPALAFRRLARPVGALTAGVLTLTVAVGATVLIGTLSATVTSTQNAAVAAIIAADVRAGADIPQSVDARHAAVDAESLRGREAIAQVWPAFVGTATIGTATSGSDTIAVVAAPASALTASASSVPALPPLAVGDAPMITGESVVTVTAIPVV